MPKNQPDYDQITNSIPPELMTGTIVEVIKRNIWQEETWRYTGRVTEIGKHYVVLEACFERNDLLLHGMLLAKGDRFLETYYTDRWYNIYQIHAREDDHIRGWYCNISYPARIEADTISYIDLELDLLVFPDGRQLTLDEDQFNDLPISEDIRKQAINALEELKLRFSKRVQSG